MIKKDIRYFSQFSGYGYRLVANDEKYIGSEWNYDDGSYELNFNHDFNIMFYPQINAEAKVQELPVNKLFFNKEQWKQICSQQ